MNAADFPQTKEENLAPRALVRHSFIVENKDLFNQEGFPIAYNDATKEEERAFMEVELFEYVSAFIADAIVNGVTDASWAKFLEDLKTYRYYDWLDWWQGYVNRDF